MDFYLEWLADVAAAEIAAERAASGQKDFTIENLVADGAQVREAK